MIKRTVFSGIQPTGIIHLGNYLGAVQQWVARQDETNSFICVVDLHALTVPQEPAKLREQTRSLVAQLLACGLDPNKTTLFVQSHVRAHTEACWLLNCITPVGWLQRMTQFKDKSVKQESVSAGLLNYPVLQAGDIILYDAHDVPVGEDQQQHVELSRDIAIRFNHLYEQEFFVVPQAVFPKSAARVMGLNDPTRKMSKSELYVRGHGVTLIDEPQEILRSFKKAVTDNFNEIRFSDDPERAGVQNLLGIYQAVTGKPKGDVEADFANARGYGDLKVGVAEVVIERLTPMRERYTQLMDDPAELDRLIAQGAERAAAVAEPKVTNMKQMMGLTVPASTVVTDGYRVTSE